MAHKVLVDEGIWNRYIVCNSSLCTPSGTRTRTQKATKNEKNWKRHYLTRTSAVNDLVYYVKEKVCVVFLLDWFDFSNISATDQHHIVAPMKGDNLKVIGERKSLYLRNRIEMPEVLHWSSNGFTRKMTKNYQLKRHMFGLISSLKV